MPDLQYLGVRMSQQDEEAGQTRHTHRRITLGGKTHRIGAVDPDGKELPSFRLEQPGRVYLPLPTRFRGNIDKVSIAVINEDGSLTVLNSSVVFVNGVTQVTARLGRLPALLAVGISGAPAVIPTAPAEIPTAIAAPTPTSPDTGGRTPSSSAAIYILILGLAAATLASATMIRRSRDS